MEVPKILHDIVDGFEHNETHYYPSPISACSLNTTIYRGVINCSNCNFLRREHFLVHSGLWSRFEEAIKQRPDDEPIMLPLSVRPKAAKFLESYFRRPVKYYISHWIPHESKQMEILVNVIDPLLEHRKQDLEFCLDRLDFDLNRLCVFGVSSRGESGQLIIQYLLDHDYEFPADYFDSLSRTFGDSDYFNVYHSHVEESVIKKFPGRFNVHFYIQVVLNRCDNTEFLKDPVFQNYWKNVEIDHFRFYSSKNVRLALTYCPEKFSIELLVKPHTTVVMGKELGRQFHEPEHLTRAFEILEQNGDKYLDSRLGDRKFEAYFYQVLKCIGSIPDSYNRDHDLIRMVIRKYQAKMRTDQ